MFLGIFCTMAGWVEAEHPSTGWENRAELGMRVQACCVQRVKRWAFAINDAFFFVLRGSLLRKGTRWIAQTPPPRVWGALGAWPCALLGARNGLTAAKERDARPQFLLCGTRIRQVPPPPPPSPFASIFSETLVWLINSSKTANEFSKGKKSRRFFFPFLRAIRAFLHFYSIYSNFLRGQWHIPPLR